jgi:hypothetical protein
VLENLASSLDIPYNYLTALDQCSIQRAQAHKGKQMNHLEMITLAFTETRKAEDAEEKAEARVKAAGIATAKAYPNVTDRKGLSITETEAIRTALILSFPKAQQALITADKAMVKANWSDEQKAKRASVQTKVSEYFIRLCKYAWPKPKAGKTVEGESGEGESRADKAKSDKADQWAKTLSTMLDQAQKMEGASFDIAGFVKALSVARSFVAIVK